MFKNILVVCIGNICRSPMAEALLRERLAAEGEGFDVQSAGLGALVGHPADEIAQKLMAREGIDISGHRARQLDGRLVHWADLILVMETSQKKALEKSDPSARGRVYRLGEWGNFDVPDPYRRPEEAFEHAFTLISQGVSEWIPRLRG